MVSNVPLKIWDHVPILNVLHTFSIIHESGKFPMIIYYTTKTLETGVPKHLKIKTVFDCSKNQIGPSYLLRLSK